ncbi:MAG: hypothetical protein IKZ91_00245, partial [Bacteroidales bacterium]|nr:hypothetical protein [Bacteroidales bacterium]
KMNGGFKVSPKDGGYMLQFTDEEFTQLIANYLRPATKKILFPRNTLTHRYLLRQIRFSMERKTLHELVPYIFDAYLWKKGTYLSSTGLSAFLIADLILDFRV